MIAVVLALLAAVLTDTAPVGRANEGRVIAERNCGACHAIGRTGASPRSGAPPLRALEARYPLEDLEESLAEGISVGHPAMPSVVLDPQQIADFKAYLRSLSGKPARRLKASFAR